MNDDVSRIEWPIVVVDDDELARALVVRHLHKLGLRNPVVEAIDGDMACEVLAGLQPQPVLMLLDLEMPGRSGLEVLEWVRGERSLAELPVVMLTGSAELGEIDSAYGLGIVSYLVKPVGYGALDDVLRRVGLPWAILPRVTSGETYSA